MTGTTDSTSSKPWFRVYYQDGVTAEPPDAIPPIGVQAILQRNEEGEWHIRTGKDYYVWRDGVWIEVDIFGLFDYLMQTGIVLFGRTISNTEFGEILARAMRDKELIDD